MKTTVSPYPSRVDGVSNPWREAIEALDGLVLGEEGRWFPILGGRLLKKKIRARKRAEVPVSNPWREAIEVVQQTNVWVTSYPFPILGGRLLKYVQMPSKG